MATMELEDSELVDPHPDIHELFRHYNSLYFDDALDACILSWSSTRMTSCAGTCQYLKGGGCQIRLSEPLLKFRPTSDLKNTLLHEMIHAFLWIMSNNEDHSDHGPTFRAIMNTINSSSVADSQRPSDGYNITIYHDFHKEVNNYRVHHWICESCGDLIKRAMNREPSANDCIKHRGHDKSCGNLLCHWHGHKMLCSGKYTKIAEPPGYKVKRRVSKDAHENDGNKYSGSSHGTKQSGGRLQDLQKLKGELDSEKSKKITMFFQPVGDAAVSSGIKSLSGETQPHSSDETKQLKSMAFRTEGNALGSEIPQTARKPECRKKHNDTCTEKKKSRKHKREITVAIPCLDYYADEESEEDIVPLVNKRSERRKKERLMKQLREGRFDTEVPDGIYPAQDGSSADHPLICVVVVDDDDDNDGEKCISRTTSEDRREAYKNASQVKLHVEDNVVYISD